MDATANTTRSDSTGGSFPRLPGKLEQASLGLSGVERSSGKSILYLCLATFGLLAAWAAIFPYTVDGDAVLHYLNTHDMWLNFKNGLCPWSRPLFKLLLIVPALGGMYTARMTVAVVSVVLMWQTIRLAEDLKLPRSLLAGPLLIFQPMAFALAGDTMTEMPMALGIVVAVRLWMAKRWVLSGLVIGLLPAVRPEGFLLGVLWGAMVLASPRIGWTAGSWAKRGVIFGAMLLGLMLWCIAGKVYAADWLIIIHGWSWPPESYPGYGSGSIYHYVILWPYYCGLPLTILFFTGLRRSMARRMVLLWGIWGLVFGVHSILYWGGWFASCGLVRIMACTSPITALICLQGWNAMMDRRARRAGGWSGIGWSGVAMAGGVAAWGLLQYCAEASHWECFPLRKCTAYVRAHKLMGPNTLFFPGNRLEVVDLDISTDAGHMVGLPAVPEQVRVILYDMPIGSIGIWDNCQAPCWHGITIDELASQGFTVLYEAHGWAAGKELRYAVMQKTGVGPERRSGGLPGGSGSGRSGRAAEGEAFPGRTSGVQPAWCDL
jgi:hypothetical protein